MAKFDGAVTRSNNEKIVLFAEAQAFGGKVFHQELKATPLLKWLFGKMIGKVELFDSALMKVPPVNMEVLRQVQSHNIGEEWTKWYAMWGASTSAIELDDANFGLSAAVSTVNNAIEIRRKNAVISDRVYRPAIYRHYEKNRDRSATANITKAEIDLKALNEGVRNKLVTQTYGSSPGSAGAVPVPTSSIDLLDQGLSDGLGNAARIAAYGFTGDNWVGSTSDHTNYAVYGVNRAVAENAPMRGVVRRVATASAMTDQWIAKAARILTNRGAHAGSQILWMGDAAYDVVANATRSTGGVQITDEQQQMIKEFGISTYFKTAGPDGVIVANDANINSQVCYLLDRETVSVGWDYVATETGIDPSKNYAEYIQQVYMAQVINTRPSANSLILIG